MERDVDEVCRVCGEPTTQYSNAACSWCVAPFHLALRQDIPARDCGQVWINEQFLALEFACNDCLAGRPPGAAEQPAAAPPAVEPKRRYARRAGTRAAAVARGKRRRPGRNGAATERK